jgi:hypothetical protein
MAPSCVATAASNRQMVVIRNTVPCVLFPGVSASATASAVGSTTNSSALSARPARTVNQKNATPKNTMIAASTAFAGRGRIHSTLCLPRSHF